MKKSIVKNYIYNLMYQILILILPLITTPYISRVLGANNIGIYSYILSISTYFILFGTLGISMYGQREIAYLQNNKEKYSIFFWEIMIFRFITIFISMSIYYFIFVKSGEYKQYYAILLLEMISTCLDISWLFQGLEEFKKIVIRNMIVKIISVICIFTFVKSKNDLVIYFFIYVFSILFANLSLWIYIPKYIKKIKIRDINVLQHIKPTINLFIPQIAIQIYTVLDKVMIGSIILDKSEVGFYEQSQKIIKMLLTVVTSLGTVMLPRIANTYINGDNDKINQYMNKTFHFVFFLTFPMIFGIISVADNFVPLFFGQGYEKVTTLMKVISPIILVIGLSTVIGTQYLLPTKRQKEFTISVIIGAIVNFFINIILIRKIGALGAAIGTVVAESIVTLLQLIFIKNQFNICQILYRSLNYLLSSFIMFIMCLVISNSIYNKMYSIICQCICGTIIYIVMLLLIKDKFLYEVIGKMKRKCKNKNRCKGEII